MNIIREGTRNRYVIFTDSMSYLQSIEQLECMHQVVNKIQYNYLSLSKSGNDSKFLLDIKPCRYSRKCCSGQICQEGLSTPSRIHIYIFTALIGTLYSAQDQQHTRQKVEKRCTRYTKVSHFGRPL